MSYDLWAWKWSTGDASATPAEIAGLPMATDQSRAGVVPGITELVIDPPQHPALGWFDSAKVLTILRERLGRHFILDADQPSLLGVELSRDRGGRGWRMDFAVHPDLVEHLIPHGVGPAFWAAGLVVFDAWKQRILPPGVPKRFSFETGATADVLYEPDWSRIADTLIGLPPGGFAILTNHLGDYVQCAGSRDRLTVECRQWNERGFSHAVAGSPDRSELTAEVEGPSGPLFVRRGEVLRAVDAVAIFDSFYRKGGKHGKFHWRDISTAFPA